MSTIPFAIVDVFAEQRYAGNQLGVFRHSARLTQEQMQCIAKELNFSETTFIASDVPQDGGYDVRIFTPESELPFAGHPTLGTAHFIRKHIIGTDVPEVTLNLGVGPITVRWEQDGSGLAWMTQMPPVFGAAYTREEIAPLIGLDPSQLDNRYPIQVVSTGMPSLIVPLHSITDVQACRTNLDRIAKLGDRLDAKVILVFAAGSVVPGNHLHARVFVPSLGVPEDPATGSAAGNLTGYLARHRYFGNPQVDVRMEQGYAVGRPSLLYLRGSDTSSGHIDVQVGGKTFDIAQGEWPV